MSATGGSGGVGKPTTGADIVQNMFEQTNAKPLEAQQQVQSLREQSQVQTEQRSTVREGENQHRTDTDRRERSDSTNRAILNEGPVVQETEMDQFLARRSDQQMQRDAGRNLSRPQTTVGSANAQTWTVANSPNTSEAARALLQQKQGSPQQPPTQRGPQTPPGTPRSPADSASAFTRSLPMQPRSPQATADRAMPTVIHYARAYGSSGETPNRPFAARPFSPETMLQQVQKQLQSQLGSAAQQFANTTAQVAVNIRGNLVFVKDGQEFRAFRLNKDGSLSELPSEDGKGQPLSPEAEALLGKVLSRKTVQVRKGDGSLRGSDKAETGKTEGAEKGEKSPPEKEAGAKEGPLDFETRFALLLHEVLEEGREVFQPVGEEGPSFPAKSDWEAFFARMLKLGNQEKDSKKAMEDILGMIFRGLFKKGGKDNVMVGDLKYSQGDKTKEQKFTQVGVDDEGLLKLLAELKPGQKIDQEQLKKIFGAELSYLELDHITEQLKLSQAEESGKNVVFNAKGNIDPFSQARLERSIFGNRKSSLAAETALSQGNAAPVPEAVPPQNFPANVYELLGLRESYRGRPRLYAAILYTLILAALGIGAASFFFK